MASDVKRYEMQSVHNGDFWHRELRVTEGGDWVRATDYEALEARLCEAERRAEAAEDDGVKLAGLVGKWTRNELDLRRQLAQMREALRPFAALADMYDPPEGDDLCKMWGEHQITLGELRSARAALTDTEPQTCRWWLEHRPSGTWMGKCGKEFTFGAEMEPEDAGWVYCPCGKPIEIAEEADHE